MTTNLSDIYTSVFIKTIARSLRTNNFCVNASVYSTPV